MCWRTCFLRRMESLAKGIHYNICACARKETTEGGKKTRRYERALHDTRVLTCLTSGSRHVRHPGLGMFDIRVSVCTTPGCRTQEKGLREKWHRKETIQKHATKRKTNRKTAEKKIQKKTTAQQKNRHRKLEKGGRQPGKHEASHNPTNLLKEDARCIKC